jgi:MFS family permease
MHVSHTHIQRIFKIKSEIQEVYWNLVIQTFAKSLVGIFIPIYLLKVGFSLHNVLLFALLYFGTLGSFSPFSGGMTARVGFKHQILYRIPVFVFFYSLLILMQFVQFSLLSLLLTAVLGGISSSLYWIPLNSEFVRNTKKIHEGEEIAAAIALPRLFSIAAPTIAAIILTLMGFSVLFAILILLVLISVIPLFATGDYTSSFSFSKERKLMLRSRKILVHQIVRGTMFFMEAFVWPVFIFLTLHSLLDVGIAVSISAVGIAFFTFLVGKLSDRVDKKNLTRIGGFAYALVWFSRSFSSTPLEIFLLSLLGGMFASLLEIAVFSSFCDMARGRRVLDWVVSREIWLGIGRSLAAFILLASAGYEFHAGFVFAGLASLLFLLS